MGIMCFLTFPMGEGVKGLPNPSYRLCLTILGVGLCGKTHPSYRVVFDQLRCWVSGVVWSLRDEFLFDELLGAPQQTHRLKKKLIR